MVEILESSSEYNYLLVIAFFLFGILSFYLFKHIRIIGNKEKSNRNIIKYKSSNYINYDDNESTISTIYNRGINFRKKLNILFFIGTILRTLSILGIFLINNKKDIDYTSLLNLVLHVLPSYLFIYEYLTFIEYIIKLYSKKKFNQQKIILKTSIKFIVIFLIILSLGSLVCSILVRNSLTIFFYFTSIMLSILFLLVSYLYFKEGLYQTISLKFKNKNEKNKYFIRIIIASLIIGLSYLLLGGVNLLIAVGFFKEPYQNLINHNLYDFLWFIFAEFLAVLSITLKKEKTSKKEIQKSQNGTNHFKVNSQNKNSLYINNIKNDKVEPLIYHSNTCMIKTRSEGKELNKLEIKDKNNELFNFSESDLLIDGEDSD